MKQLTPEMWYTWERGNFVGSNKPVTRATISKSALTVKNELFRTQLFSADYSDEWFEIPGIKSVSIDRRIDAAAATMNMSITNLLPVVVGENLDEPYDPDGTGPTKRELMELGEPGVYTYRHGLSSSGGGEPNPWGHVQNEWVDVFLPNRVIKTFQGYGTDSSTYPWDDTKLAITGIWLVDTVSISVDGSLQITCRDLAKLLIEQRLYPPIIPLDSYPLRFCGPYKKEFEESETTVSSSPETVGDNVAVHSNASWDSSAAPWYGYNASVYGHRASHAFDGDLSTYWISMRNSKPSEDWSYEWLDAACNGEPINRIRFKPWKGNYTLYVGVKEDGVWQGDATVPYNKNAQPAYPNGSNIKYLKKINMPAGEGWYTIDLDRVYNAQFVRLVFTDLQWFGKISGGDYRAGVYEFEVSGYTAATSTTTTTDYTVVKNEEGNIEDYTDIVKLLAAWSGFYWPEGEDDPLFLRDDWGAKGGRVWGDFFYSGAYPIEPPCIDASYWDNKSVMDGINQIKEILGFISYVDTTGGLIWRPPNIWRNGNFMEGVGYVGESSIPVVHEDNVLIDYGIMVDDKALRSEIVVVSSDDPSIYGSYAPGYAEGEEAPTTLDAEGESATGLVTDHSLLAGQQRVMLVPDYPFGAGFDDEERARAEVQKFAYLISLWIHWSYRKGRFRIPGNPGLEVDDQIRIYERTTSETYIHYITGLRSTMDLDAGTWYMDADTHWLGNGPDSAWHLYLNDMTPALAAYLCAIGQLPDDICDRDGSGLIDMPADWWDWEPVDIPAPLPRDPDALKVIFPRLPDITWTAPDFDYESPYPIGTDPDGVVSPPSGTSGGTVLACTPSFFFAYWPGTGPGYPESANRRKLWFNGASGSSSDCYVDRRAYTAFKLLSGLFQEEGIYVYSASGKVIRKVKGSSTWSNHSWGVAVDINGSQLPWGTSIYSYPAAKRDPYLSVAQKVDSYIRALDKNGRAVPVFKWGQNFSKPDPMHWQVCAKAEDLARGVWDTRYPGPV